MTHTTNSLGDFLQSRDQFNLNIAYTRRRFLKCMVSEPELAEMAELEKLCFSSYDLYDQKTLRMFVSLNGSALLRHYVAIDGGPERLAGFMLFDCLTAELITLDINPDFRRRGIGRHLMQYAMGKLAELGHKKASSHVEIHNLPSLALHENLGFKRVGRKKNYYGDGRDAYILKGSV